MKTNQTFKLNQAEYCVFAAKKGTYYISVSDFVLKNLPKIKYIM